MYRYQQPGNNEAHVAEGVRRLPNDPLPRRFTEVRAATDVGAEPATPRCQGEKPHETAAVTRTMIGRRSRYAQQ
jgi:hypothetical protein